MEFSRKGIPEYIQHEGECLGSHLLDESQRAGSRKAGWPGLMIVIVMQEKEYLQQRSTIYSIIIAFHLLVY